MLDVFVPGGGMAPDDVTLTSWLKNTGDRVVRGETVAVVETAKAELEIEADGDGVLGRRLYEENDRIAPGTTIARILGPGEADPEPVPTAPGAVEAREASPATTVPGADGAPAEPATADDSTRSSADDTAAEPRHRTSPRQRRLAAEAAATTASPAADRPVQPAATPDGTEQADAYRSAISASVTRSWQEIPHFAVSRDLVLDDVVAALAQWRAVVPSLTLTDLLLRALALASMERAGTSRLDLGLAVATDRGVAIPVVRDVLSLGLVELAAARAAAADRARAGRLNSDDARSPAGTLSNLGAVEVDRFTGVVPYGQTALLTVGRAAPRPVVLDGALAIATTMTATLNVDHRSWDGLHAGQFLQRLAAVLAAPATLLAPTAPNPEVAR